MKLYKNEYFKIETILDAQKKNKTKQKRFKNHL